MMFVALERYCLPTGIVLAVAAALWYATIDPAGTTLLAVLCNEQFLSHSVHSKENGLAISFTHPVPQGRT